MKKKTVLVHSNFCRAFTGFGKNKKNILRYLFNTGKYNIVELANGVHWQDPSTENVPWTCRGALPPQNELQGLSAEQQRAEGYGNKLVDKAIEEFKPDVYIGIEDIWAFGGYQNKPWWNKINTMVWTTLDSLPLLPQAVDFAPKAKNYFVWSTFAENAFKKLGYTHIKTLRGSLDTSCFYRFCDETRSNLRSRHNLSNEYIIGFVFRNQLRKSVPNILDGYKLFKKVEPKAKLLLHTHWSEGWDIGRMLEEKNISFSDILTTYVCSKCGDYQVRSFSGQEQNCQKCGSQKTVNTTNTGRGVTEEQLNEVYNLMDVYCHPFTSGGQEIPVQEAKLTELITLVTNYSCGEGEKSRQWVIDNFSVPVIGSKLEEIIDAMPEVEYDYDLKKCLFNPDYIPKENYVTKDEFLIDIYKEILNDDVDKNSGGFKHWMAKMQGGMSPQEIITYFKNVAIQEKAKYTTPDLSKFLGDEKKSKRIAVVIPQSETDVLLVNSLLKNLKNNYKKHKIYVFTQNKYFPYIDDNPYIEKLLSYSPIVEDTFLMEGISDHEGYFEAIFYPHSTTQKHISYIHNAKDKMQFSVN